MASTALSPEPSTTRKAWHPTAPRSSNASDTSSGPPSPSTSPRSDPPMRALGSDVTSASLGHRDAVSGLGFSVGEGVASATEVDAVGGGPPEGDELTHAGASAKAMEKQAHTVVDRMPRLTSLEHLQSRTARSGATRPRLVLCGLHDHRGYLRDTVLVEIRVRPLGLVREDRREGNDLCVRCDGPEPLGRLCPVHLRHHVIEDDHI